MTPQKFPFPPDSHAQNPPGSAKKPVKAGVSKTPQKPLRQRHKGLDYFARKSSHSRKTLNLRRSHATIPENPELVQLGRTTRKGHFHEADRDFRQKS